jgi:hypothetical protein
MYPHAGVMPKRGWEVLVAQQYLYHRSGPRGATAQLDRHTLSWECVDYRPGRHVDGAYAAGLPLKRAGKL